VVLLVAADGVLMECTDTVRSLTGLDRADLLGRPVDELLAHPPGFARWVGDGAFGEFGAALRHRDGHRVEVDVARVPMPDAEAGAHLFLLAASAHALRHRQGQALVRALLGQDRIGLVLRGAGDEAEWTLLNPGFFGLPTPAEGGRPRLPPSQTLVDKDAVTIDARLREVLRTGEPLVEFEHSARRREEPGRTQQVSVTAFRLEDGHGQSAGVAAVFLDITEQLAARTRLTIQHAAANRLGQSLDVTRNAEALMGVLVPDFADLACVDLSELVLSGGDSAVMEPGMRLRRVAVASADGQWPTDVYQQGEELRARALESDTLGEVGTVVVPDLASLAEKVPLDAERRRLLLPASAASALYVPLLARGHALGVLGLWRGSGRQPYAASDVPLVEEIASRAALSLDNARRYSRERNSVVTLQRSLLPAPDTRTSAAETAGLYAPAVTPTGTGGIWYDVVRLSGVRVAFVVGKVVGHGVHAAAAMGRLRSAVQTLADLDLPPAELLAHLDDLVRRLGESDRSKGASLAGSLYGATCLYITYDPVTGECHLASAGHPGPLLVRRRTDTASGPSARPGPALGVGTEPFDPVELALGPGDVLALHSGPPAGATAQATPDLAHLRDSALAAASGDTPVSLIGERLLRDLEKVPRHEDFALLLTRVDRIPPGRTVHWELPADLDQASRARELAVAQLLAWGLEELAFSTELIVSELVTNAIRYAGGPIGLRLVKDRRLVCEVSDPSQAQPHLRRARMSDEGGRGLFLIAQIADRWGSRYTADGKTIWTEQAYPAEPAPGPGRGAGAGTP
jgi:anti-sigma regulatory factor (Ser/Thr protein kinase)/PAS domain-containing protein